MKDMKYSDEERAIITQRNFENWFHINRQIAEALYHAEDGLGVRRLIIYNSSKGVTLKRLKNGERSKILLCRRTRIGGRGTRWIMTALGKDFYYRVFVLNEKWDWEVLEKPDGDGGASYGRM